KSSSKSHCLLPRLNKSASDSNLARTLSKLPTAKSPLTRSASQSKVSRPSSLYAPQYSLYANNAMSRSTSDIKIEEKSLKNGIVKPPNGLVKPTNGIVKPPNGFIKPQNGLVKHQNGVVKPVYGLIKHKNGLGGPKNDSVVAKNGIKNSLNGVNPTDAVKIASNNTNSPSKNDHLHPKYKQDETIVEKQNSRDISAADEALLKNGINFVKNGKIPIKNGLSHNAMNKLVLMSGIPRPGSPRPNIRTLSRIGDCLCLSRMVLHDSKFELLFLFAIHFDGHAMITYF
ncbi:unnamed protein product, partial [Owenia fusiformis]